MMSSTIQNVDLSFKFLLPLISCCLYPQSGSGGSWCVHMATRVLTCTSWKKELLDIHC